MQDTINHAACIYSIQFDLCRSAVKKREITVVYSKAMYFWDLQIAYIFRFLETGCSFRKCIF